MSSRVTPYPEWVEKIEQLPVIACHRNFTVVEPVAVKMYEQPIHPPPDEFVMFE
jgi:hypothetical protein